MADMNSEHRPQGHLNRRSHLSSDHAFIHTLPVRVEHLSDAVATLTDPVEDGPNFPSGELTSLAWEGWWHTESAEERH